MMQVFQAELYRSTLDVINSLVIMEKRHPFTMGSEEFSRLKSSALHEFKAQLDISRNPSLYQLQSHPQHHHSQGSGSSHVSNNSKQDSVNRALAALAEIGYTGLNSRDLTRLRDNPDDDEVLHVMAASDAYFRLAFKRLGDIVPMHIDYHFLGNLAEGLEKEMIARLGVLEKDTMSLSLMVMEDRFVMERRKSLLEQKHRLEKVYETLHEYLLT